MAQSSDIEWTEATWNPSTGCDRISAGCDNCYALTMAKRLKAMGSLKYQRDGDPHTSGPGFGVSVHESTLAAPFAWKSSKLVFVNSMSDLFHAQVPKDFIRRVFEVMEQTPQHTYQVLTKRPSRALRMADALPWPANVWLGTSVEDETVLHRVDALRGVPAATRFISAEPLIGPLDRLDLRSVDWLIVGGESGPKSRVMKPEWVDSLLDNAAASSTAFFFKQWGGRTPKANGRLLHGREWNDMPKRVTA